ncbi:inositol-pentakisphosphate 2-kinase [Pseudohyphozyma bogoriensis]|nr:inositol-pentakisphosphate 2-kinase [Pseudohyphozyma bogoriensis]
MASAALLASSPSDWTYTSEGGANLVLAYTGPSSPHLSGKVLRLRKSKLVLDHRGEHTVGEADLRFSEEVVGRLLGKEFMVGMEKVKVDRKWMESMGGWLRESRARPVERAEVDEVDVNAEEVVLAEDLVGGEGTLAIEIKATHLSPTTLPIKTTYCRFCMHSYLKAIPISTEEAVKRHQTSYCPLDLFSSDKNRVELAIERLWDGWVASSGKANNLRLFLDGKRLDPDDPTTGQLLTTYLSSTSTPTSLTTPLDLLKLTLTSILLSSALIPTLKSLQSSLSRLDIEGVASHILASTSSPTLSSAFTSTKELETNPTTQEWIDWLPKLSTLATVPASPRDVAMEYLLSATFKDCSIFITLEKTADGVLIKTKAIDLDPKPLSRIPKYWAQDQEIVETFRGLVQSSGGQLRRCTE